MPYETFTPVDFALDERFRQWVRNPTLETIVFWEDFLNQNPQQRTAVAEARQLVAGLKVNTTPATPQQLAQLWSRNRAETDANSRPIRQPERVLPLRTNAPLLRRAAVWDGLLLIAGLAW